METQGERSENSWHFHLRFQRVNMIGKILVVRAPQMREKIIKSTNSRSINNVKITEDSVKRVENQDSDNIYEDFQEQSLGSQYDCHN